MPFELALILRGKFTVDITIFRCLLYIYAFNQAIDIEKSNINGTKPPNYKITPSKIFLFCLCTSFLNDIINIQNSYWRLLQRKKLKAIDPNLDKGPLDRNYLFILAAILSIISTALQLCGTKLGVNEEEETVIFR